MSDPDLLPFKLRQAAAYFDQPPPPENPPPAGSFTGLLRSAANEIERLRGLAQQAHGDTVLDGLLAARDCLEDTNGPQAKRALSAVMDALAIVAPYTTKGQ